MDKSSGFAGLAPAGLFAVLVASLGSGFQYGYSVGIVNGAQKPISYWIGNTTYKDSTPEDAKKSITFIYAVIVAIFRIGAIVGIILINPFLTYVGLKRSIVFNNIFAYIASGLMSFAITVGSYWMLIVGRFFTGINAGLGMGLTSMYLTEIAPISTRGAIGASLLLFIKTSILVSQLVTLRFVLGNEHWPFLFCIPAVVATFQVIFLPFCADSPSYLYAANKKDEARKALVELRGRDDVDDELNALANAKSNQNVGSEVSYGDLFIKAEYRKPLIISIMVVAGPMLSAYTAIMIYSTSILEAAGLADSVSQYGTVSIGIVNVLLTFASILLIDKLGRKTLLVISFATMTIDLLLFFGSFMAAVKWEIHAAAYASILFQIFYVMFYAAGAGFIPNVVITELFAHNARSKAVSIALFVAQIADFGNGLGFPIIQNLIGPSVFLIYIALQTIFLIYIIAAVPETKNKSIEEITAQFKK